MISMAVHLLPVVNSRSQFTMEIITGSKAKFRSVENFDTRTSSVIIPGTPSFFPAHEGNRCPKFQPRVRE